MKDPTPLQINRIAQLEGWAIFNSDLHGLEIERVDEDERNPFSDDDTNAVTFVAELARAGSALHKAALRIHARREGGPWCVLCLGGADPLDFQETGMCATCGST